MGYHSIAFRTGSTEIQESKASWQRRAEAAFCRAIITIGGHYDKTPEEISRTFTRGQIHLIAKYIRQNRLLELQELAVIQNVAIADVISSVIGGKKTILHDFIETELDVDREEKEKARQERKLRFVEEIPMIDTRKNKMEYEENIEDWETF